MHNATIQKTTFFELGVKISYGIHFGHFRCSKFSRQKQVSLDAGLTKFRTFAQTREILLLYEWENFSRTVINIHEYYRSAYREHISKNYYCRMILTTEKIT